MNVSVCVSELHRIFCHVACGRGLVLLWQLCKRLCTSGFVNDAAFSYNGPSSGMMVPQPSRCNMVYGLTRATAWHWVGRVVDDGRHQD